MYDAIKGRHDKDELRRQQEVANKIAECSSRITLLHKALQRYQGVYVPDDDDADLTIKSEYCFRFLCSLSTYYFFDTRGHLHICVAIHPQPLTTPDETTLLIAQTLRRHRRTTCSAEQQLYGAQEIHRQAKNQPTGCAGPRRKKILKDRLLLRHSL